MEAVHLVKDFEEALSKKQEWITLTFSPQQVRYFINVIKCTNKYARNRRAVEQIEIEQINREAMEKRQRDLKRREQPR